MLAAGDSDLPELTHACWLQLKEQALKARQAAAAEARAAAAAAAVALEAPPQQPAPQRPVRQRSTSAPVPAAQVRRQCPPASAHPACVQDSLLAHLQPQAASIMSTGEPGSLAVEWLPTPVDHMAKHPLPSRFWQPGAASSVLVLPAG